MATVRLLVDAGADPRAVNRSGQRAADPSVSSDLRRLLEVLPWEIDGTEITYGATIASGDYGIVYKAEWLHEPVAIKIPKTRSLITSREMSILTRPNHPNIVRCFGVVKAEQAIVLEYADSGSLRAYLRSNEKTSKNLRFRVTLLLDVALGVRHLHNLEPAVVHRDLKCSNIVVTHRVDGTCH